MSSAMWDWLRREGLDTLRSGLTLGAGIVDARQSRRVAKNNAVAAKFGRSLDLFNLALHRKHLEYDRDITRRLAQESVEDARQAGRQMAFYDTELGLRLLQQGHTEWLTESRIRELNEITRRELDTQWLGTWVKGEQLQTRRNMLVRQQSQLAVERGALDTVEEAALGSLSASRARAGVEREATARSSRQRQAAIGAGARAIGASQRLLVEGSAIRGRARVDQLRTETGTAIAGGAARGMRGSFRQTGAMMALTSFVRDERMRVLEEGAKAAELTGRMMRLRSEAVDVRQADKVKTARLDEEAAKIGEEQARITTGAAVKRAGFDVRGAQLAGTAREQVAESHRHEALIRQVGARRGFVDEQIERTRRAGALEAAAHSLAGAQARLSKFGAERDKAKSDIERRKKTYEVNLGHMASQIAAWQLKKLPSLPDYEGMGTRSALAMAMRTAAGLVD